jgi:hypothetical protein
MSLDVAPSLIEQAERGQVDEAEFLATVARSLPYAWSVMSGVAEELAGGITNDEGFADHATPPPSEAERGQLLRALASDAIRGALERHFCVRFAFQNCHRVAAFRPADVGGDSYREFVSVRSQILNQSPALRDC